MRLLFLLLNLSAALPLTAEIVTLVARNRPNSSSFPSVSSNTITLKKGDRASVLFLNTGGSLDITINGTLTRMSPQEKQPNQAEPETETSIWSPAVIS